MSIKESWNKANNIDRYIWKNMIWGLVLIIVGVIGDNNWWLIAVGTGLIYIPGLLNDYSIALGKDIHDRLEKQAEEERKAKFFGGVQTPPAG